MTTTASVDPDEALRDRVRALVRRIASPTIYTRSPTTHVLARDVPNPAAPYQDKRARHWWGMEPVLKAGWRVILTRDYGPLFTSIEILLESSPTLTDDEVAAKFGPSCHVHMEVDGRRSGLGGFSWMEIYRPGDETADLVFDWIRMVNGVPVPDGKVSRKEQLHALAKREMILGVLGALSAEQSDYGALKLKHGWHPSSVLAALYSSGKVTLEDILEAAKADE
jgi:hypothetical protein